MPENLQKIFTRAKERQRALWQWVDEHPRPNPLEIDKVREWEAQYDAIEKKLRGDSGITYNCPSCRDTGWWDMSNDPPTPCPHCKPFNPERLQRYSGVPERRWRDTFETFNVKKAPSMAEALKAAKEFAARESVPWLVLAGPIGSGKTHLCYGVANRMSQDGVVCRFWNVAFLLDTIRSTYEKKDDTPHESLDDMVFMPTVLILDDLGAEKSSDWVTEKLFEVIDRRYSEGKGLMITTNEPFGSLAPRLQSRFKDKEMCRVVVCDSPDYRAKLGRGK